MVKSSEMYITSEREIQLNFNSCSNDIQSFGNTQTQTQTQTHTWTRGYRMIFNSNFYKIVNERNRKTH